MSTAGCYVFTPKLIHVHFCIRKHTPDPSLHAYKKHRYTFKNISANSISSPSTTYIKTASDKKHPSIKFSLSDKPVLTLFLGWRKPWEKDGSSTAVLGSLSSKNRTGVGTWVSHNKNVIIALSVRLGFLYFISYFCIIIDVFFIFFIS